MSIIYNWKWLSNQFASQQNYKWESAPLAPHNHATAYGYANTSL